MKGGHHDPLPGDRKMKQIANTFMDARCRLNGHQWVEVAPKILVWSICSTERKVSKEGAVSYTSGQILLDDPEIDPVEDWVRDEDDEEPLTRMCLWCGKVCESLEALDLHEEECEP